jgi:hypothetical protein
VREVGKVADGLDWRQVGWKRRQKLAGLNMRVRARVGNEAYGSSSAYRRKRIIVDTQ